MKAIETEVDGYLFRSLLEARWAIFFKTIGIEYRYEHQGFDLEEAYYLPDFWLPKLDAWVEIKATFPTDRERRLSYLLASHLSRPCFITFGECWVPTLTQDASGSLAYLPDPQGVVAEDSTYYWAQCEQCGAVGLTFAGLADRLTCGCWGTIGANSIEGHSTERLCRGYFVARQFRPGVDHQLAEALKHGR